jgi:hypothetical protein
MPLPEFQKLWHEDDVITRMQENFKAVTDPLRKAPTIDVTKDANGNNQFGQAKPLGTHIIDGVLVRGIQFPAPVLGNMVHNGTGAGTVSAAGAPSKSATVLVTITTAGAVGTSQFTVSPDGGKTSSAPIFTQAIYTEPTTGVLLSFSGTFVVNDTYSVPVSVADVGVSHGLGRAPNGFKSVNPTAPAHIFKSPTANPHPEQALLLNAQAAVTTDLWIF